MTEKKHGSTKEHGKPLAIKRKVKEPKRRWKRYFMGVATGLRGQMGQFLFTHGGRRDRVRLGQYLLKRYGGEQAVLCKNGRSALALALKAYCNKGDGVIINGFTCYAVVEAVREAGCVPIYADISSEDLNFNTSTLARVLSEHSFLEPTDVASERHTLDSRQNRPTGEPVGVGRNIRSEATQSKNAPKKNVSATRASTIIIQNTLGNPVDIVAIEKFAREHNLTIIEDLAHCAGVRYPDGREVGTVGVATALSFGKEKSIDTISGGAVVLRQTVTSNDIADLSPHKRPRASDTLRARFYPLFGAIYRGLSYVRLGGLWMRFLLKIHWVERSADNKMDLTRRIASFEAKIALKQMRELRKTGEKPLRDFVLVNNREEVLAELRKNGYFFDGFWYEKPVSPERYYKKVHFPEDKCPVAVAVSQKIINFPTYYSRGELKRAREIVKKVGEEWGNTATMQARDKVPPVIVKKEGKKS